MSNFCYVLTLILLIAKVFGLISISYLAVFFPILLLIAFKIILFPILLIIAIVENL